MFTKPPRVCNTALSRFLFMSKKYLVPVLLAILVIVFFGFDIVYAQSVKSGLEQIANQSGLNIAGSDVATIIGNIIGTAMSFIAVLFFILMLYGGVRWMVSRGNDEEAKKALDTIIATVIGMVIVISAYAITSFVFESIKKQDASLATSTSAEIWCVYNNVCRKNEGGICLSGVPTYGTKNECRNVLNAGQIIWCKIDGEETCMQGPRTSCPDVNVFESSDACVRTRYYVLVGKKSCVQCLLNLDCPSPNYFTLDICNQNI